jgi:glutamate synthase domain-containing protein 3
MSGGIAYVLDVDGEFRSRCNTAMVELEPVLTEVEQKAKLAPEFWHGGRSDEDILRGLLEAHVRHTGSRKGQEVLSDWARYRGRFVKIFPKEYRRALSEIAASNRKAAA